MFDRKDTANIRYDSEQLKTTYSELMNNKESGLLNNVVLFDEKRKNLCRYFGIADSTFEETRREILWRLYCKEESIPSKPQPFLEVDKMALLQLVGPKIEELDNCFSCKP